MGDNSVDVTSDEAQDRVQRHLGALERGAQLTDVDIAAFLALVDRQLPQGRRLQVGRRQDTAGVSRHLAWRCLIS
jgi:hypothetical protein